MHKTVKARDLWRQIAEAAWECADPGVQYDTTINEWHTSPEAGRINASNPCSEYMFLDNTACNLASLNLIKFVDVENGEFDIEAYRHAVRLWTVVLEISVLMAQFPSKRDRAALLRLPHPRPRLRQPRHGADAARLAVRQRRGPRLRRRRHRDHDRRGVRDVRRDGRSSSAPSPATAERAAHAARDPQPPPRRLQRPADEYEGLSVFADGDRRRPRPTSRSGAPPARRGIARWPLGEQYGYRNAQTTVLAPTGTIGLLMDCDTTGVEPDFALVKFKKLAGGGYFKIANQSIEPALQNLGYTRSKRKAILTYVLGTMRLDGAPAINRETLKAKGFTDDDLEGSKPRCLASSSSASRSMPGRSARKR